MRNNRILGVAIAAALSLQVGAVQAVGFENVNETHAGVNTPENGAVVTGTQAGKNLKTGSDFSFPAPRDIVHVPTDGIVYACDLLDGDGPAQLPSLKEGAALYTISTLTDIATELSVTFTLIPDSVVFATEPVLAISDVGGNYTETATLAIGATNQSTAPFLVQADKTGKALMDGDQLMFVYQIKNASNLIGGGEIELQAEVKKKLDGTIVNPTRKATIATCKDAVTTELKSEDDGIIKISVSDDSKKFVGSGGGAYVSDTVAQLGFLKITNLTTNAVPIMESDGETQFQVGLGVDGLVNVGSDSEGSKLEITGGQFAASKTPDGVYLVKSDGSQIKGVQASDNTTATFQLDDADLQALSIGSDIGIQMAVDSTTAINVVENPPEVKLTIDFKEAYVKDIGPTDPVQLRQIDKDGTTCVAYNVPAADSQDDFSIRITNDSGVAGSLTGKMYDSDGNLLKEGPLNGNQAVEPNETIRIGSTQLDDAGFSWTGRAMLEITSTLPSMEMLALIRNKAPDSPLANMSVGAKGESCTR